MKIQQTPVVTVPRNLRARVSPTVLTMPVVAMLPEVSAVSIATVTYVNFRCQVGYVTVCVYM